MKRKIVLALLALLLCVSLFANGAQEASAADSYPNKAITMIIPYGVGGANIAYKRA